MENTMQNGKYPLKWDKTYALLVKQTHILLLKNCGSRPTTL